MKKVRLVIAGWLFIGLGIAGLALPFVPGLIFILLGLVILSSQHAWAHRLLVALRRKFPNAAHFAELRWARLRQRFTTR